jgi:hypothetical protein
MLGPGHHVLAMEVIRGGHPHHIDVRIRAKLLDAVVFTPAGLSLEDIEDLWPDICSGDHFRFAGLGQRANDHGAANTEGGHADYQGARLAEGSDAGCSVLAAISLPPSWESGL